MCDRSPSVTECLTCARPVDVLADDACPTCGSPAPEFAAYRADGWPLCPRCGEDELWSPLVWGGRGERPTVEAYLAAGVRCYRCGWESGEDVTR